MPLFTYWLTHTSVNKPTCFQKPVHCTSFGNNSEVAGEGDAGGGGDGYGEGVEAADIDAGGNVGAGAVEVGGNRAVCENDGEIGCLVEPGPFGHREHALAILPHYGTRGHTGTFLAVLELMIFDQYDIFASQDCLVGTESQCYRYQQST